MTALRIPDINSSMSLYIPNLRVPFHPHFHEQSHDGLLLGGRLEKTNLAATWKG